MMKVTRAEMKRNAKASLKGRWGLAIGVTVLFTAIILILSWIVQMPFKEELDLYTYYMLNGIEFEPDPAVMSGYYILTIIMDIVISPIVIGVMVVFMRISRGQEARVGDMFTPISRFLKIAGLFLLVFIKTFLWTLLFIIPGIIAAYRYSMAFYIMAENPDIGIVEAIERSKVMMKGNKWRLFVLQLSFIGWMLLAPFTFGILLLWLLPYMETTFMNFYNALILEQSARIDIGTPNAEGQSFGGGQNENRGYDETDRYDRDGDRGDKYSESEDADDKNDW
ncbi:MAG: DUF975 family protein [Clostridia bacterium]|nr:DUF975 family protein [Clostridia bacterium]